MPSMIIVDRTGDEHRIDVETGRSVMELIRDAGFDDLLALCGGCCSCATCHVIVEPKDVGRLPSMSPDENDLLGSTNTRQETSRLSCQIVFVDELDGLRVTIAPEE